MFAHSLDKYVNSTMRQTSNAQGWSNILAERWSHSAGELPRLVPRDTEVAVQLSGQSLVDRAGGGRREHTHGHRGTIWLCPAGVEEEYINVAEPIGDCLHLFLPGQPFSETVQREFDIDPARARLRYQAIDHDPFVTMIADQIVSELSNETGVGRLFIESLSVALSAHLLKNYSELGLVRPLAEKSTKPLDSRRLSRVVDFIDGNLDQDFTVLELAGIACMSVGHFTRSFRAATGRAPHAFVAERRLMMAKRRLRDERCSIEEIALSAGFSSLANFSKAFRHSTGLSPSQYRARI